MLGYLVHGAVCGCVIDLVDIALDTIHHHVVGEAVIDVAVPVAGALHAPAFAVHLDYGSQEE